MKVTNVNGTSANPCRCGSWLEHWKRFGRQVLPTCCPAAHCLEKDLVGAHVQKDSPHDSGWYIVPLCKKHNGEEGKSLTIADYVVFVSANVAETCGKR